MKLPKAYLAYIQKLVSLFQAKMLLMDYDLKLKPVVNKMSKRYRDGYTAEIETDTRYLDVEIRITGKLYEKWRKKDYREIALVIAHELAHIYTDPYYELFWDYLSPKYHKQLRHINEQQTERIARLVMLNVRPEEYIPK